MGTPTSETLAQLRAEQLATTMAIHRRLEHRQARLLTWMLLFIILFSTTALFVLLIFNPHHEPQIRQYAMLISGLMAFFTVAYLLNRAGYYTIAAMLLVFSAIVAPWASVVLDPSVLEGDFVPLTYELLSVLLSSILLPTYITIALAVLQFAGLTSVLLLSSATPSFNWFSFLAFIFLTSVLSILANNIIQRNMRQIDAQAHQLALNEVRLQELSVRDHLTSLFNPRHLEATLEREIQRAARTQQPLGVIMMDVDHFKRVNDTLGHAAGDVVLRELGQFLARQVRRSDVACRYAGDEFLLILPETSRETAKERAEQLRNGVKELPLPVAITISIGVAIFPEDGTTSETILKSADTALYQAKRAGRDHVTVSCP
ncbi:MAG: GGDEF domain-containing protein [Chloroflexales bacterium]